MDPVVLIGPAAITVATTSWWAPLPARRALALPRFLFSVANGTAASITLDGARLDPLCEVESGASANGQLTIAWAGAQEPVVLGPGEAVDLVLGGIVSARASRYATKLHVLSEGRDVLAIPVSVKVAARPALGVTCMLIGLGLAGMLAAFQHESEVQDKLRTTLRVRQQVHEFLEKRPPLESQAQDQSAFDEHIGAAISALSRRRSPSIVDRRVKEADEQSKSAEAVEKELRGAQENKNLGQAETEALAGEWNAVKAETDRFSKEKLALFVPPVSTGMAARAQSFISQFRDEFLLSPMNLVWEELASEVGRVQLAYASGDGERARAKALVVRRWVRRASREMDDRLGLVLALAEDARQLALDDDWIRKKLAAEELPKAARIVIAGQLDRAASQLPEGSRQPDFAAARASMQQALTELKRGESQTMKSQVAAALKALEARLALDNVTRVINEVTALPDRSRPGKIAGTTRIMEAWRERIAGLPPGPGRSSLSSRIEAALADLRRGDLEAVIPLNLAIRDEWIAETKRQVAEAGKAGTAPVCEGWRLDLRRDLDGIERSLRLADPRAQLKKWEKALGELRDEQLRISTDDCLDRVVALGDRALTLGNEIFTAALGDAAIAPDARLRFAEHSGVSEAIGLSRKLLTQIRPLTIAPLTGGSEQYVGRAITFAIENLDQSWRQGVEIGVDFGDGTAPLTVDAEQLGHNPQVTHSFAKERVEAKLRVTAYEGPGPGPDGPATRLILGQGTMSTTVIASPLSRAERIADELLNARFLLALLIAGVVYYWRFHVKDRVFGMQAFDYVQAFALGFVVAAATADLPKSFEGLFK